MHAGKTICAVALDWYRGRLNMLTLPLFRIIMIQEIEERSNCWNIYLAVPSFAPVRE